MRMGLEVKHGFQCLSYLISAMRSIRTGNVFLRRTFNEILIGNRVTMIHELNLANNVDEIVNVFKYTSNIFIEICVNSTYWRFQMNLNEVLSKNTV